MTRLIVSAPAKLNLGLEVVGRRPDGYHDLVTIMQTVSLCDRLTLAPTPDLRLTVSDPALVAPDNLALLAARRLRERAGVRVGAALHLDKAIPAAAGLGGASSDAAATLLALRRLWGLDLPAADLADLAATLGSDVPFFLQGGTALVTGRGERIESLPPLPPVWFVVVAPRLAIPRKTVALYAALTPADFSPGDRVRAQAARLRTRLALDPTLLGNVFARALYARRPELAAIEDVMRGAGAPFVALSGAGPSHYTAVGSREIAAELAAQVARVAGGWAAVLTCEPWRGPPRVSPG